MFNKQKTDIKALVNGDAYCFQCLYHDGDYSDNLRCDHPDNIRIEKTFARQVKHYKAYPENINKNNNCSRYTEM